MYRILNEPQPLQDGSATIHFDGIATTFSQEYLYPITQDVMVFKNMVDAQMTVTVGNTSTVVSGGSYAVFFNVDKFAVITPESASHQFFTADSRTNITNFEKVEFRNSDPTDLAANPTRIWARTDTGDMKYTVDGTNIVVISNSNSAAVDRDRNRQYIQIRRSNIAPSLTKYVYPTTLAGTTFALRYDENPVIYKDNFGKFITNWDTSSYKNVSSKKVYMNTVTGTSSNDGLTPSTPCQSLEKALTLAANGDTVIITNDSGTTIGRSGWALNGQIYKSLNIIAQNSDVVIFKGDLPTWTLTAGFTTVYEVTRSAVIRLVDMNDSSRPVEFTKLTSIAEVSTTPYSWFTDNVKVYVNVGTNRTPNQRILPILQTSLAICQVSAATQNIKLYVENLLLVGGDKNIYVVGDSNFNGHELYTKNCKCYYSTALDSILVQNARRSYHRGTLCAYSVKDGFNYSTTIGGSNIVDFIEVDTTGFANGDNAINTANTHNGSTAHAKSYGVRVNCTYYENVGGNLIDVQGVKSINLGCTTFDSRATDIGYNQGFGNQGAQGVEDPEQWFEGCISFGNYSDVYVPTGSTVHVKQSQYDTVTGGGTKDFDARL